MIPPAMDEQQRRRRGITPIDVVQAQALREVDARGRSGTVEVHPSVSLFSHAGSKASAYFGKDIGTMSGLRLATGKPRVHRTRVALRRTPYRQENSGLPMRSGKK